MSEKIDKIDNLQSETKNEKESSDADNQAEQALEITDDINKQDKVSLNKKEKEQEIYKNVLDKLELGEKNTPQVHKDQEKSLEQTHLPPVENTKSDLKEIVENDFQKIDLMMRLGLINPMQGQALINNVLKKAFDVSLQKDFDYRGINAVQVNNGKDKIFDDFSKDNPDFFESSARKKVLDYLKTDDVMLRKEDLSKISDLIETIENCAVDRYIKQQAYDKSLNDSNQAAKQKLKVNAQSQGVGEKNFLKVFTREQIGKMSSAEFAKNEPFIMEQLRKGLIK